MTKTILFAILLIAPAAWAAAPKVMPVPDCFPCNDFPGNSVTAAPKVMPVPDCFPCNDFPGNSVASASRSLRRQ
jgi:hypothetical protein